SRSASHTSLLNSPCETPDRQCLKISLQRKRQHAGPTSAPRIDHRPRQPPLHTLPPAQIPASTSRTAPSRHLEYEGSAPVQPDRNSHRTDPTRTTGPLLSP